MGLGELDLMDGGGGGECIPTGVPCSVCFEMVTVAGDRSCAKLRCGHQFHLDCIGSAFNAKGAMQCPNCRDIEKGQWLYANGCRPVSDFRMEDLIHDEDLYELSYAEMTLGIHWCPFSGLTSLPSSLDEADLSLISSAHPCPYVTAYVGPIHPSSVARYRQWEPSPYRPNARVGVGASQPSMTSATQRTTTRNSYDIFRPGVVHPVIMRHRGRNSAPSSAMPHFARYDAIRPRSGARIPPHQGHYQHLSYSSTAGAPPAVAMPQVDPANTSSVPTSGSYFVSSSSSARSPFQEVDDHHHNHSHSWEPEHRNSLPLNIADWSSIWTPFHPPATPGTRPRRRVMPSRYHP